MRPSGGDPVTVGGLGHHGERIPASFIDVYRPVELAVLAGAGLMLAVLGAAVPASWSAGTRVATALRAE